MQHHDITLERRTVVLYRTGLQRVAEAQAMAAIRGCSDALLQNDSLSADGAQLPQETGHDFTLRLSSVNVGITHILAIAHIFVPARREYGVRDSHERDGKGSLRRERYDRRLRGILQRRSGKGRT